LNLAFDLGDRYCTAPQRQASPPLSLGVEPLQPTDDSDQRRCSVSLLDRLDRALGEDGQLI
jgi:hypothetical protein